MSNKNINKKKEPFSLKTFVKDTVWIVFLITIALVIKSNTVELFKIPTGSMEPTLYGANELGAGFGDHLFVKRWSYGLTSKVKIPIIGKNLPLPKYHIFKKDPKVGDIVVFENPWNKKIDYIKRCCGTPGDRVSIKDGNLYVNGTNYVNSSKTKYTNIGILSEDFNRLAYNVNKIVQHDKSDLIKDAIKVNGMTYRQFESKLLMMKERNENKKLSQILQTKVESEVVVPTDSFFMLGDNSGHSSDSRFWGFAHTENLKGQAWIVYLPINRIRMIQ